MTTEITPDPQPEPQAEAAPSEGSMLRQERDRAVDEAKAMRQELMTERLEKIGLSAEEGLGVAIVDTFDGVPTVENLASYAAEKYRYEPPTQVMPEQVVEPQQRIEQVEQSTMPVTPEPATDQVVAAENRLHGVETAEMGPQAARAAAQDSLTHKVSRYRQVRDTITPGEG